MRKKSLETVLYSTVGVIVMGLILIAFNVITATFRERIDLTQDKAYTLSKGTHAILREIKTPLKIRFYCTQSQTASPYSVMLKTYAKKVEDLLDEYKQDANGKVEIERFDPQPDSDAEDSARLDGIEPQTLPGGEKFYLGLAVSQGLDNKQSIPFLSPGRERQLEYDISRTISRVLTPKKPVVGIMSPLPVFGTPSSPMMGQSRQGEAPWTLITELKQDYTVKRIEMDTDRIDKDVNVLVVIHPRGISDKAQYAIDQFVMRGGKLIAFLDAQSLVDTRNHSPMRGMPGGGSSLDKLLKAWGLHFDTAKVVADRNFAMQLGQPGDTAQERPAWLALTSEGISSNDIATAELNNIWMFSAGAFTGKPAPGLKETVLLKSTKDSELVSGMLANYSGENVLKDFKPSGVDYALAVRLTGKFKTAFPDGEPVDAKAENGKTNAPVAKSGSFLKESKSVNTVVLVGDSDMIYDGFTLQRVQVLPGMYAMRELNGNLSFAQNLVEQLSGDENLIAVRSRTVIDRPFTRVKKMEAEAQAEYLAKIKDLEQSRDQAVARLNELQSHKSQSQRFILSPEQEAEIENLRKKEAEISRQLRDVNKQLRHNVIALQHHIEWLDIAAVPLAVCVVGISLAFYKRKRTSAK